MSSHFPWMRRVGRGQHHFDEEQTTGRVNPEQWTHGSAEERERWFRRGYSTGEPNQCNTLDEL